MFNVGLDWWSSFMKNISHEEVDKIVKTDPYRSCVLKLNDYIFEIFNKE